MLIKTTTISLCVFMCCALILSSCSSGSDLDLPSEEASPVKDASDSGKTRSTAGKAAYSLSVRPQNAFADTRFSLFSGDFNVAEAELQWMINGKAIAGAKGMTFTHDEIAKGDRISAKAIFDANEVVSSEVTVRNTPPVIQNVALHPEVFKPGDTLFAEVEANDPDGDPYTLSYEWTKNGAPAGSEKNISSAVQKGDTVYVRITPFDGEDYGRPFLMQWGIMNTPPMISEDDSFVFDGKVYSFQVKATDPDGDPLTFSLRSAPQGMGIDPSTGRVTWDVPDDFTGDVNVTVAVTDGVRGETTRDLTLSIKPPAQEK